MNSEKPFTAKSRARKRVEFAGLQINSRLMKKATKIEVLIPHIQTSVTSLLKSQDKFRLPTFL